MTPGLLCVWHATLLCLAGPSQRPSEAAWRAGMGLTGLLACCGRFVKTGVLDCSLEDRRNMSGQLSMDVGRWFGSGPRYVRAPASCCSAVGRPNSRDEHEQGAMLAASGLGKPLYDRHVTEGIGRGCPRPCMRQWDVELCSHCHCLFRDLIPCKDSPQNMCCRICRSGAGAFLRGGLRHGCMSGARPRTGPRQAGRRLQAALPGSRPLSLLKGPIRCQCPPFRPFSCSHQLPFHEHSAAMHAPILF